MLPHHTSREPSISAEAFDTLLSEQLPMAKLFGISTDYFGTDRVDLRAKYNDDFLRPGGTVAGPVMMTLADAAMFGAVLAHLGPVALAVTTNLSIDFLRKPPPDDVIGSARILKLGKRLAVGDIMLHSVKNQELVARASATYSLPAQEV